MARDKVLQADQNLCQVPKPTKPPFSTGVISSLSDACGGGGTRYKTSPAKEKTPFPLATVIGAIAVTALFMFLIFSLVNLSDISGEVSSMRKELASLSEEEKTLSGQAEYRYSKLNVEENAEALGYGSDNYTNVYFDLHAAESEGGIASDSESEPRAVGTFFEKVGKFFRSLADFLN